MDFIAYLFIRSIAWQICLPGNKRRISKIFSDFWNSFMKILEKWYMSTIQMFIRKFLILNCAFYPSQRKNFQPQSDALVEAFFFQVAHIVTQFFSYDFNDFSFLSHFAMLFLFIHTCCYYCLIYNERRSIILFTHMQWKMFSMKNCVIF